MAPGRSRQRGWLRLHSGRRRRRRRPRACEGGQIHVQGRRSPPWTARAAGTPRRFPQKRFPSGGDEAAARGQRETEPTPAREPLPAEEIVEEHPAGGEQRPGGDGGARQPVLDFSRAKRRRRDGGVRSRWARIGGRRPLTGGAVLDAGRWFKRERRRSEAVVAAASAEGAAVRACGRASAVRDGARAPSPGPNVPGSPRRTARPILATCVRRRDPFVGRQCGAWRSTSRSKTWMRPRCACWTAVWTCDARIRGTTADARIRRRRRSFSPGTSCGRSRIGAHAAAQSVRGDARRFGAEPATE